MTFEGKRSGGDHFSRDGARMIFQSEREPGNPSYQIYLMDLEAADKQRQELAERAAGTDRRNSWSFDPYSAVHMVSSNDLDIHGCLQTVTPDHDEQGWWS
jgi:Tol biopolymer transport system component